MITEKDVTKVTTHNGLRGGVGGTMQQNRFGMGHMLAPVFPPGSATYIYLPCQAMYGKYIPVPLVTCDHVSLIIA